MANIAEIRQKYPQYNDMSDMEFARRFHNKYYSDMSFDDFTSKIGVEKKSLTEDIFGMGGIVQRVAKGAIVDPAIGIAQLGAGLFGEEARQAVTDFAKQVEEKTQKGRAERGSEGFDTAQLAGAVLSPANFIVPLRGASLAGKVASGARAGAVMGGLQPVLGEGDFEIEKAKQIAGGALLGGAIPSVLGAAGGGIGAIRQAIQPVTEKGRQQILQRTIQEAIPDAELRRQAALRLGVPEETISGYRPTSAEMLADMPESAALQAIMGRAAASRQGAPLVATREAEQELARQAAVGRLGGEFVPESIAARTTLTAPLRETALASAKPMQAESLASALETVANSTKYKGSGIAEDSLRYFSNQIRQASTDGVISPEALYNIRQRVGQDIQGLASQRGISAVDAKGIAADTSVKKIIDAAIERTGGKGWKDYLTAFEQESTKINRQKVGAYLQERLGSPLDTERAGAFATAVQNAAQTLKTSTGASRYTKLEDLLTKAETKDVYGTLATIQRQAKAAQLARKAEGGGAIAGGEQIPQFLSRVATITNAALKKLTGDANEKLNLLMTEAYLDPQKLAALMSAIPSNKSETFIKAILPNLDANTRTILLQRIGTSIPMEVMEQDTEEMRRRQQNIQTRQQPQSFNKPQTKTDLQSLVSATIQQKNVPPELARVIPAVIQTESSWNPTASNKTSSAKGLFQMTNAARADVGIPKNATIQQDIEGGIDYLLKQYRKYGDVRKAVQAYNQGHYNPKSKEGKQYVASVFRNI